MLRPLLRCFATLLAGAALLAGAGAQETASVPLADGFDLPVGRDGTKNYFKARGYRPNGHLGEDWNGQGGGDTDLGDPVYATAHGIVVFAQDYRLGWGNVVIVRHAYFEEGQTRYVDSLYGHLHEIAVRENQTVRRGQLVGTIGNNRGMYNAHLHFEMRKNLQIGMHRSSFARDFSNYWDPTQFIEARRTLAGAGRLAAVPVNTFAPTPPPPVAGALPEPLLVLPADAPPRNRPRLPAAAQGNPRGPFRVDRFSDMRESAQ